ncbi:MAG: DUF5333 domain-containing protein [Pseudomonadota bacterium]
MSVLKLICLGSLLALPSSVWAKPPLRDVEEIDNELYFIAIANEIDEQCITISGRRMKALGVMWDLKRKANALGYSDAEIRAYIGSDSEKARMRRKGERYIASRGVTYSDPETFCALGRAEIERNSAIGVYLRAR